MNILLLNIEKEAIKLRRLSVEETLGNLELVKLGELGFEEWRLHCLTELDRIDNCLRKL